MTDTGPASLVHHFRPRGVARDLIEDRRPEVVLSGPAGTGKSRACLEKVHLLMLANPGARWLIVRKTLVSLSATGLKTFEAHVAKEHLDAGGMRWFGGSQREQAGYRYANGSFVAVGGMDKPSKIMSSEYDGAYVQEATELTEDDWEAITTRLRWGAISFQQLVGDCNPDAPTHWLRRRADRGQTVMLESRHEDNPVYFDEAGVMTEAGRDYIEGKLDQLTGVRYHRLRRGQWVAAEGTIYEDWDPAVHMVPWQRSLPRAWPRYWSVDFGFTNPFVLQRWALDPDGRLVLYAERYRTRGLVEDHARAVLEEVAPGGAWREPPPRAIICDHDAEDRATLERHLGMSTVPAKKAVASGIQLVQARLKVAGDGRPRLQVMRDARTDRDPELVEAKKPTCTAEEVPGYVWEPQSGGAEKAAKEVPRKVDDHGMDAERYVVAHLDSGPVTPGRGRSPSSHRVARGSDLTRRAGGRLTR